MSRRCWCGATTGQPCLTPSGRLARRLHAAHPDRAALVARESARRVAALTRAWAQRFARAEQETRTFQAAMRALGGGP